MNSWKRELNHIKSTQGWDEYCFESYPIHYHRMILPQVDFLRNYSEQQKHGNYQRLFYTYTYYVFLISSWPIMAGFCSAGFKPDCRCWNRRSKDRHFILPSSSRCYFTSESDTMLLDELFIGLCVVFAVRVMHVDTHMRSQCVGNGEEPSRLLDGSVEN